MTQKINKDKVEHICGLAKLKLAEDEREKFAEELADIVDYIEKLAELDTEGVEPTAYPVSLKNVLREDKVEKSLNPKKALENVPDKIGSQVKVPAIMSDNK